MTTLVIGARGSVGRLVLDQLLAAGEPVRASVRNPAATGLPAGVPVVTADLTDPATLPAALDGVQRVFLYSNPDGIEGFAKAAEQAGVRHVVVLSSGSVLLDSAVGNAIAEEHRQMERVLADSGLHWTPIRPLVLANNALSWAHSIRAEQVVRLVYPDTAAAPIHEHDIASVAVAALRGATEGVSEMLTGPARLSQRDQVGLIAQRTGTPIEVHELSEADGLAHLGRFLPPHFAAAVVELLAAGDSPRTATVEQVLGRPALPFERWVDDHVHDFR